MSESGSERFGPLVRDEEWRETERSRVEVALEYAREMSLANPQENPERAGWWWHDRFDAALLEEYPEWKWVRQPQLGLEDFSRRGGRHA